jgi:hypothetical protein
MRNKYDIQFSPAMESASDIAEIADLLLKRSGAIGKFPTPIHDLINAAEINEVVDTDGYLESVLQELSQVGSSVFNSIRQKLRGIADMRERVIFVPKDRKPREMFARAHELGHQTIPWHNVQQGAIRYYQDDDLSLCSTTRETFDIEANFFAAEVIFQGKRFQSLARDYRPTFDAVFALANMHGASTHATLRRYAEAQDETLAVIAYWPSHYSFDGQGLPVLQRPRVYASESFLKRYENIDLPQVIAQDHPWAEARKCGEICEGEIYLPCDGIMVSLSWQAWWNKYALLIMLRKKPVLSLVGKVFSATALS